MSEFVYIRVLYTSGCKVYAEGEQLVVGKIIKAKRSPDSGWADFAIFLTRNPNDTYSDLTWVDKTPDRVWFTEVSPLELLAMEAE